MQSPVQPVRRHTFERQPYRCGRRREESHRYGQRVRSLCAKDRDRGGKPGYGKEAVEAGADIIMLDNMDPDTMKKAVELIGGRAQTECSGNVTKENISRYLDAGVDFISSGALTHSAPILDISMKNLHAL